MYNAGSWAAGGEGDSGPATSATFAGISSIAVDNNNGVLYIADGLVTNQNEKIRQVVLSTGIITAVPVSLSNLNPSTFGTWLALKVTKDGTLLVADSSNYRVLAFSHPFNTGTPTIKFGSGAQV